MQNEICIKCSKNKDCESICSALELLYKINKEQKIKDKTIMIRKISRQLNLQDAEPNKEMQELSDKIVNKFREFNFIKEYNIQIGYVISYEHKNGEKTIYADCRKLTESIKAYLPYDFLITFYECNTGNMNGNQKKILMYHELKHIGIGEKGVKIIPHDIEDFKDILAKYGLEWNEFNQEVPDIL